MNPFADFHTRHHHRFGNLHPSSSSASSPARRDPHRQQMTLFDSMFSPMRVSLFDPFGHNFGGHQTGSISSFNISFGFVFINLSFFLFIYSFFIFILVVEILDLLQRKQQNPLK